jgi:hypothetical protein
MLAFASGGTSIDSRGAGKDQNPFSPLQRMEPHYGALEARPGFGRIECMPSHLPNHRHGLRITTPQGEIRMFTISYMAASLHRTRWTVLHWERIGLLPPAPFVINPKCSRTRRRLYPEHYVEELARIMTKHYPSLRLERESWRGFQEHVYDAYNRLVMPLLGGVKPPGVIELTRDRGQGNGS